MKQKFAVVHRPDETSRQLKDELAGKLGEAGWTEDERQPDLVFAIGGDGTFLYAVHEYLDQLENVKFVGIHSGTLGFFCDYRCDEMDLCVQDVTHRSPQCESARLLQVTARGGGQEKTIYALNEMRIENVTKTQLMDIDINGSFFETFRGTGLCLCTQIGSTAYNRSLGGAVIESGLPLLQLSEITGIHHRAYRSLASPLILRPESVIQLRSASFEGAFLCYDHLCFNLAQETEIEVFQSQKQVQIARYRDLAYLQRLRILF